MDKQIKHIIRELSREGYSSKIYTDPLNRLTRGTDAGIYRLVPRLVIQVNNEHDVVAALNVCRKAALPFTFKAGGTSLSGQTITNSVLIETGTEFTKYVIEDQGRSVTLQPGITGGLANAVLARYNRKIGPSPASIASAKIGGIIANNASGASYGIATNSYNTLKGMRLVFADGSILDTQNPQSVTEFRNTHTELISGIAELSDQVKANPEFHDKIRHKYQLKNTTGYGLNSLIDFNDPVDILWHLAIGSEGTLAFISEASFHTVDSHPLSAAALLLLPDIYEACRAIGPLIKCEVSAAELMDRNAMLSVRNIPGIPQIIKNPAEGAVALLLDTSAPDEDSLSGQIADILHALGDIRTLYPVEFIKDKKEYNRIWKVRKGLFTSAAATRPGGTSCLIEDVAFRPDVLADALVAIRKLVISYRYEGSVMWGHLLDGNVHFVIMPDFRSQSEINKYSRFMDDFVKLTVHEFDGSLKAEHGTGRNMAPFVKEEWGEGLYSVMKSIKKLCDPQNLLNPGVLLNDDPQVHLKNLKPIPVVNEIIDNCIECGFCENDCPSKNLTLTPRQRIVAYREIYGNPIPSARTLLKDIKKDFNYQVDETCATDGLCALACPVSINTGSLVKELRFNSHGKIAKSVAAYIGNHLSLTTACLRGVLNFTSSVSHIVGKKVMKSATGALHKITGGFVPQWNPYVPSGSRVPESSLLQDNTNKVIYYPSCINRVFGRSDDYSPGQSGLIQKTISLLNKAGYEVIFPEDLNNLCCGMAFDSKGYFETGLEKAGELEAALLKISNGGKIPVLCDMSPCLLRMKETLTTTLELYEPVEFILKFMVDRLHFKPVDRTVTVHSTCSSIKMGLTDNLVKLARMCCTDVIVPLNTGCCGWAGDRGFTVPELNASALKNLKAQLPFNVQEGYSTSRTCEIGLSVHTGLSYKSILYLVDECT